MVPSDWSRSRPFRPCHQACHRAYRRRRSRLGLVGDDRLGGEEEGRDRRRVLQRRAGDLGGVGDAGLHQVLVLTRAGVQAVGTLEVLDLLDHDATLETGVHRDLLERLLERTCDQPGSGGLVAFERLRHLEHLLLRTDQGDSAAGHDALFHGGLGRLHRVLDAVLLLLELDLGGRADLDDRHTAGQLGETLLELLTVVVGVGVLDLLLDLGDAGVHRRHGRRHPR